MSSGSSKGFPKGTDEALKADKVAIFPYYHFYSRFMASLFRIQGSHDSTVSCSIQYGRGLGKFLEA